MNTEQAIEKIKEIDAEMQSLIDDRAELSKFLIENSKSTVEKLHAIYNSNEHTSFVIEKTKNGLIYNYLGNKERHETISVKNMIDDITYFELCETWIEQLEINGLLGLNMTEEIYEKRVKHAFSDVHRIEKFHDMINDVLKAKVATFNYDW